MCTGTSGGGMQSMYFAALDERLAGAVPVCYISSYEVHMGATACVCEVPAGILRYTNQWEILALHAPRPLFCIAASRDVPVFQPAPMLSTLEKTRDVYKLYDQASSTSLRPSSTVGMITTRRCASFCIGMSPSICSAARTTRYRSPTICPWNQSRRFEVGLPANTETMQSLTFRRAGELASQIEQPRDAGHWQKLKQDQQKRLRDDILGGFPDTQKAKQTSHRSWSTTAIRSSIGRSSPNPAFSCRPCCAFPATLRPAISDRPCWSWTKAANKRHLNAGWSMRSSNKGFVVLAIDYRGAGETAGTVPAIEYGPGTPEYNLTNYSLFIGRPLAGARVVDIRCATDFLTSRKEVDADRIAIVGRGRGALSAVLAASFDDRLGCVVADELLSSWVFDEEFVDIDLAYMIPRI